MKARIEKQSSEGNDHKPWSFVYDSDCMRYRHCVVGLAP